MHILSKFTSVDRIYKINKQTREFFSFFFEGKKTPLKDDIYELQNSISNEFGQKFKEILFKYYYKNSFLDLSLTFIDGHVIAYFGDKSFQKLKHTTRGKIMKSLEIFNFSDKSGKIFYFKADHDVKGMQKNIEFLLDEVNEILGLDKLGILVFDRGGFSSDLFQNLIKKYKIPFITLAKQSEKVKIQIQKISKTKFKPLKGSKKRKICSTNLIISGQKYRTILIWNTEIDCITPMITTLSEKELSNEEIIIYYFLHWNQEQEHNGTKKIGSNMHPKGMQDMEFKDTTKINNLLKSKNKLNKIDSEIINIELKIQYKENYITLLTEGKKARRAKIEKRTDNKLIRKQTLEFNEEIKELQKLFSQLNIEKKRLIKYIEKAPLNPKKKKFKYGPIDYCLSIINLVSILNSRIVEIYSAGKEKFQLQTIKEIVYSAKAEIYEDDKYLNINFINIRQNKDRSGFSKLCAYFNHHEVKLHGKILKFSLKIVEK